MSCLDTKVSFVPAQGPGKGKYDEVNLVMRNYGKPWVSNYTIEGENVAGGCNPDLPSDNGSRSN